MNDNPKSKEEVVDFLNELLKIDSKAINELFNIRIPCNEALQDHPTVQVNHKGEVGILGILNGLFGIQENGQGYIAIELDNESSPINRFLILE